MGITGLICQQAVNLAAARQKGHGPLEAESIAAERTLRAAAQRIEELERQIQRLLDRDKPGPTAEAYSRYWEDVA